MPIPTKELVTKERLVFDAPEASSPSELVAPDAISMFERLARDESVPVEKLEKLIELQERIMRHQAKAQFDAAFAEMQGDIPIITERGEILVEGKLRSKFARNEDIQEILRPILKQYGFALRFRNEVADSGKQKVVGILSHCGGHSEQDEFVCPPDKSGGKSDIQAMASTRSYGQRYCTIALVNIATRGEDDDAKAAGRLEKEQAPVPSGYQDWLDGMTAVADEGFQRFETAWAGSKDEYRKALTSSDPKALARLKTRARQVGGGK